jgi:sialidase-1
MRWSRVQRQESRAGRTLSAFWRSMAFFVFIVIANVSPTLSAAAEPAGKHVELDASTRERCLNILRAGLRSDEFWPSIHAAEGLTLGGRGDEVRKFLLPKLGPETDDQRRCGIARELVRAGDRLKANVMLKILAGKESHGHVHAAESLFKVSEIGDGAAMRRAFAQDENETLKIMSAAALGRCGNPACMAYLRKTLQHSDPKIARIAAWVLGRIGDSQDIAQIAKNVSAAPDALTRAYYEHSLAALGDLSGREGLAKNLSDEDPAIRTYAATFAGDARAVFVADRLAKLLDDENADVRFRAAQSLLVLSRPADPDRREDVSRLVYKATKENPRYTEGSILELSDGSLLFAATEFIGGGSDFAKAQIVGRISTDGGRTWGKQRVLQENTGGRNVMSVTLRRLKKGPMAGEIALFYLQKNSFSDLDLLVRFSKDDGQTFGPPTTVTNEPGYHVVNNDRVVELSTGRLLAPAASTADVKKVNHFVSHCFISDDGGRTWRKGKNSVDMPKRGAMEPEVLELNAGGVLMIVRTQLGIIGAFRSTDGGETWGEKISLDLKAPEAPATLRRIPSTGDLLLIWNNTFTAGAGHGGKRTPLTAAISSNEGKTWRKVRNLETDKSKTFSYTSAIFVRDRVVLSYWDSGPAAGQLSTRFRSLPVSWFYEDARAD